MSTLQFPIILDNGKPNLLPKYEQTIQQAVLDRLATEQKNIFFQNGYGSQIHTLIFEQNDDVLQTLLRHFISEALEQEPRIQYRNTEIYKNAQNNLLLTVQYSIVKTQINDFIKGTFTTESNSDSGFSLGFSLGYKA
jgi:phage baseplate assembly protein W